MKSKKEKTDDKKSIKNNSMALGGKSPKPVQNKNNAPEEFSEDRSQDLRMKPQTLEKNSKKPAGKK
jgi:hypothetical protein